MKSDKQPLGYKILLYPNAETPDDQADVAVRGNLTECQKWIEDNMFKPNEKRHIIEEKYKGGYRLVSFPVSRAPTNYNPPPMYTTPRDRA